jgi:hypothetical protein
MGKIRDKLLAHCDDVQETYWQHAKHALYFSSLMFVGAIFGLLHAVFPFLFKQTSTNMLARIIARVESTNRASEFHKKVSFFKRP